MQLTDPTTGETITVRADNLVSQPEGWLWVEAMFSQTVDLTAPEVNLAGRLHPNKAKVFEWIVAGTGSAVAREADLLLQPSP